MVDGVRIERPARLPRHGRQPPSRVGDLNPEEIENIEIVKGPSAATLYGTDAANGVIVITTKSGVAGKARWNLFTEQGVIDDNNTYRTNYFGRSDDPEWDTYCTLVNVGSRATACRAGWTLTTRSTTRSERPLSAGHRQQYGVNVAGGSRDGNLLRGRSTTKVTSGRTSFGASTSTR